VDGSIFWIRAEKEMMKEAERTGGNEVRGGDVCSGPDLRKITRGSPGSGSPDRQLALRFVRTRRTLSRRPDALVDGGRPGRFVTRPRGPGGR